MLKDQSTYIPKYIVTNELFSEIFENISLMVL